MENLHLFLPPLLKHIFHVSSNIRRTFSRQLALLCNHCFLTPVFETNFFEKYNTTCMGRDSSVGIATRYGLDGPGDRIPVGARFSTPVQTGPGAHPASCTMGTGSFSGVKRSGRGADHPSPHLSAEVMKG